MSDRPSKSLPADYQPALPGITPPLAGARRRPGQRKGESWQSYAFRHETWRRATYREKTPAERAMAARLNAAFRSRRTARYAPNDGTKMWRVRDGWTADPWEQAKANLQADGKTPACIAPVFFWFGGGTVAQWGSQAQYLNAAGLAHLRRAWLKQARRQQRMKSKKGGGA